MKGAASAAVLRPELRQSPLLGYAALFLGIALLPAFGAYPIFVMMAGEPRLALALLTSLARRLSLRLRQVSARLSALLSGG